jgi:putative flippase GtrA
MSPGAVARTEDVRAASVAHARLIELITFGAVGAMGFVIDVGLYNLLRATFLQGEPIEAKVISVVVATVASWLGNRFVTFRGKRGGSVLREAALFALINLIGLLISAGCLFVSHYLLGYRSQLDDNISANGVGLVLGTTFRFLAYRLWVFRSTDEGPISNGRHDHVGRARRAFCSDRAVREPVVESPTRVSPNAQERTAAAKPLAG